MNTQKQFHKKRVLGGLILHKRNISLRKIEIRNTLKQRNNDAKGASAPETSNMKDFCFKSRLRKAHCNNVEDLMLFCS
jgi:hypothetical protein